MFESARVTMRNYLSTDHLYASRYAAEVACERENELAASAPVFDIRLRGLAITSVMEAVAFLEAAINELYQDAADAYLSNLPGLPSGQISLLSAFWQATDNGNCRMFLKYDTALQLCEKPSLDRSRFPYQDAVRLVNLRNHIMHYRPEHVGVDIPNKIADALKGRFDHNRAMASSGNPPFPDLILGAGCADWSWRTARSFAEEFTRLISLSMHYQKVDFGDPLPK